jgi:hypothetical protein
MIFRFDWRSRHDNAQCSVQWGEGTGNPLGFMNSLATEIRNPERFGFKQPVTRKNFKDFVQRFADAFEEDE